MRSFRKTIYVFLAVGILTASAAGGLAFAKGGSSGSTKPEARVPASNGTACATAGSISDGLRALIESEREFASQAHAIDPEAVLRQVDINWQTGFRLFAYSSPSNKQQIDVQRTGSGEFKIVLLTKSPLLGWFEPLDLSVLRVGPEEIAALMQQDYPNASVQSMTAYPDPEGCDVLWRAFSQTGGGVVAGTFYSGSAIFGKESGGTIFKPPVCADITGNEVPC